MKMGSVYFIRMGKTDVYKIGYSTSNPRKRIDLLQLGNPHKLKYFGIINTLFALQLEGVLHEQFASKRLRGEWFEIPEDEAKEAIIGNGGVVLSPTDSPFWTEPTERKVYKNTCTVCGRVRKGNRKRRTCSNKCRQKASRKRRNTSVVIEPFKPASMLDCKRPECENRCSGKQVYCSAACRQAVYRARSRMRSKTATA